MSWKPAMLDIDRLDKQDMRSSLSMRHTYRCHTADTDVVQLDW
jgi:hypothetical protein